MSNGHSTLAIADLPFMYSIVTIFYISSTGNVEVERLYVVGLIAGLIGTFLVILHPLQRGLDITWYRGKVLYYRITHPQAQHPKARIILTPNVKSALATPIIRYEKDKMAGTLYFVLILTAIIGALRTEEFLAALSLADSPYLIPLTGAVYVMTFTTAFIAAKQLVEFDLKLALSSLYFLMMADLSQNPTAYQKLNEIKRLLEQSDWVTARLHIDDLLRTHWNHYGTKYGVT